jgi:alkylation response protein AidB-like acyl-CoA dehydrogenase
MDFRDSPEQARFRAEARAWLADAVPAWQAETAGERVRGDAGAVAAARAWQRRAFAGGWAGLDWPRARGGRGASPIESGIFAEEAARAGAPDAIVLAVGAHLVGPTLIACGADWQRERFLAPILRGDELWCQGFSEPEAGSDLAALRTRALRAGDEFLVSGQKLWTSFARHADWCLAVVRTDPDAARHAGLTMLLIEMRSPGVTVRPLREMTGAAWFHEVFFDAVRVPARNVVGAVGGGWDVVRTTLAHERAATAAPARLAADLERLMALARRTPGPDGRPAAADPRLRQRLAQHAIELGALRVTAWREVCAREQGAPPGPEGATLKLAWSELDQRVRDTAVDVLGLAALVPAGDPAAVDDGFWGHELLWSRAATIYAGTSEMQRDGIARRVLGLPR